MDKKLTPKLKELKEEFDFIHRKIGDLEWERATLYLDRKAALRSEVEAIDDQIDNYRENMSILIEKIKKEVSETRKSNVKK